MVRTIPGAFLAVVFLLSGGGVGAQLQDHNSCGNPEPPPPDPSGSAACEECVWTLILNPQTGEEKLEWECEAAISTPQDPGYSDCDAEEDKSDCTATTECLIV